jgi:hypothetical protein
VSCAEPAMVFRSFDTTIVYVRTGLCEPCQDARRPVVDYMTPLIRR